MQKPAGYIWVVNSAWIFLMPKLSQNQELRQQLTPRQILQASLLQLSLPLLEQRILHELEINPALEMIDLTDDAYQEKSQDIEETEEELEREEEVEFEWEELLGEHEDYEYPVSNRNEEEDWENNKIYNLKLFKLDQDPEEMDWSDNMVVEFTDPKIADKLSSGNKMIISGKLTVEGLIVKESKIHSGLGKSVVLNITSSIEKPLLVKDIEESIQEAVSHAGVRPDRVIVNFPLIDL